MSLSRALSTGVAGALTVTIIHEVARRLVDSAPRMDVVGMRGLQKTMRLLGKRPPRGNASFHAALAGEVVSNSLYYALVAVPQPKQPILRGLALGALAGWGAVSLTPRLGLGWRPVRRTAATKYMTFAWYTMGGVVAGAVAQRAKQRQLARAPGSSEIPATSLEGVAL